MEGALDHHQRVHRGEDQAAGRDDGDGLVDRPGADQHEELADEVAQAGQAERREREEHHDRRQVGEARPQPAHLAQVARVQALVDLAAQDEQRARADAVRDHRDQCALQGQLGTGVDADQHEAHVRDRGVRDQALDVVLGEGHERAVDDADAAQPHRHRREAGRGLREQRQAEAHQAVGGGLEQDSGEVHRARGRRLRMRVRQPGVERHHRQLDHERHEEAQHQQPLDLHGHRRLQQHLVIEAPHPGGAVVDPDQAEDGEQHQQARGLREDEELGRRVDAPPAARGVVAPDRDQEVHRHQHHFPEEEEQEQVEREEHRDHAAEVPQQVEVEEPDVAADFLPRAGHRHQAEQVGQHDQQQRQAVEAQVHADAEAVDPRRLELEHPLRIGAVQRQAGDGPVAVGPQPQRHHQRQHHRAQRDPARIADAAGQLAEPREQATQEGDGDQPDKNDGVGHGSSTTAPSTSTAPAATPIAYQRIWPVWVRASAPCAARSAVGIMPMATSQPSLALTRVNHR